MQRGGWKEDGRVGTQFPTCLGHGGREQQHHEEQQMFFLAMHRARHFRYLYTGATRQCVLTLPFVTLWAGTLSSLLLDGITTNTSTPPQADLGA